MAISSSGAGPTPQPDGAQIPQQTIPPASEDSASGILPVDKPAGPTSYDIIRWLKPAIGRRKIGHAGTLDPLASGLLIVLIGGATKQQGVFMGLDKLYLCRMRLGVRTNTGDAQGHSVEERDVPQLHPDAWRDLLRASCGPQMQVPPMFSALKQGGRPLYRLARQGEVVPRPPRPVVIHDLSFLEMDGDASVTFRAHVSSGTYVRSLVEDVAARAGTVAHVEHLRRETVGAWHVRDALLAEEAAMMTAEEMAARFVEHRS